MVKQARLLYGLLLQVPHMASEDVKPLENYANAVGLAFQIADDLLLSLIHI